MIGLNKHQLGITKRLTAILALSAFLTLIVYLSLGSHMMADGKTCLLDELQSASCVSMSASEMVTSHVSALARFIGGVMMPTLLLLIVAFVLVAELSIREVGFKQRFRFFTTPDHAPPPILAQFTHWLARLVDSPPSLILGRP